jgi:hypothetical protein
MSIDNLPRQTWGNMRKIINDEVPWRSPQDPRFAPVRAQLVQEGFRVVWTQQEVRS